MLLAIRAERGPAASDHMAPVQAGAMFVLGGDDACYCEVEGRSGTGILAGVAICPLCQCWRDRITGRNACATTARAGARLL